MNKIYEITFYDYQDLFILSLIFFLFYYPLELLIINPLELKLWASLNVCAGNRTPVFAKITIYS